MIRDLVVEVVSPAMVGGADNVCDHPPVLRPPSIRGQLRFWARAVGVPGLEAKLFGDIEGGQRVRLLGAQRLQDPQPAALFPHWRGGKAGRASMVPPGDRVLIRFALPDAALLEPLQAVVWLWLHLGAIGRRSRRGYGSLLWEHHPGHPEHLLGSFPEPLDRWQDLESRKSLKAYLERGLEKAFGLLGVALEADRPVRPAQDMVGFCFRSLDQVFVGRELPPSFQWHVARSPGAEGPTSIEGSLEYLLHGLDPRKRSRNSTDQQQLGDGSSEPPSPMMWRLFPMPTARRGHVPVMVWSPLGYASGKAALDPKESADMIRYLSGDLGFERSLADKPLAR